MGGLVITCKRVWTSSCNKEKDIRDLISFSVSQMHRYMHLKRLLWVQHADWVGLKAASMKEGRLVRKLQH